MLFATVFYCNCTLGQTGKAGQGWPTYGGDPGGMRYSSSDQIRPGNVTRLQPVWTYHTGALRSSSMGAKLLNFEATPVLLDDTLYLTTPLDRVIALDAATGQERWSFDPKLDDHLPATNYTSRGVAVWNGAPAGQAGPCTRRVLLTTLDARLIALDAKTGKLCDDFGHAGQVDLKHGVRTRPDRPYLYFGNTSPATIVGDVVTVGSAIGDDQAVEPEPGNVRGFDVRTGRLLWTWEVMSRSLNPQVRAGAGNVWSVMAADPEHHLLFVPTSSPSPDFFGGYRPGDNRDANSLVALDARTGTKVWAFQLVHHDLWDYDVAAEPLLFTLNGVPAVAVTGKVGQMFVFNRLTGEPLFPITERAVPASYIPGERVSPTQPFSALPPLTMQTLDTRTVLQQTAANTDDCERQFRRLRYEGIYTPPSLEGTLQFPGSLGGVNWGSMSWDPTTGVVYANTNNSAYEIRLVEQHGRFYGMQRSGRAWLCAALFLLLVAALLSRRSRPAGLAVGSLAIVAMIAALGLHLIKPRQTPNQQKRVNAPDAVGEMSPQTGAPYPIFRKGVVDRDGLPCTPVPWGSTVALDLVHAKIAFQRPLGTMVPGKLTGSTGFGAPIVTAGGLLFTGASRQPLLRALDKRTGEELWAGQLPAPALATPMTYTLRGKQYVVIAAGGHGGLGTPLNDALVAFALP